ISPERSDSPAPQPTGAPPVAHPRLRLQFTVPKGKVSSLMGVLNYLQTRYGRIEITLELSEGSITDQELEDRVREAFRQMGVHVQITY
ncbi:MAG: hypothetical protein NZ701_07800, partial [Roseiflexus sp.]|nr:hypothetical protein [Roseiflexus sp.]